MKNQKKGTPSRGKVALWCLVAWATISFVFGLVFALISRSSLFSAFLGWLAFYGGFAPASLLTATTNLQDGWDLGMGASWYYLTFFLWKGASRYVFDPYALEVILCCAAASCLLCAVVYLAKKTAKLKDELKSITGPWGEFHSGWTRGFDEGFEAARTDPQVRQQIVQESLAEFLEGASPKRAGNSLNDWLEEYSSKK